VGELRRRETASITLKILTIKVFLRNRERKRFLCIERNSMLANFSTIPSTTVDVIIFNALLVFYKKNPAPNFKMTKKSSSDFLLSDEKNIDET